MGAIMVQGTTSSAGKSILCTALCRIFKQDGMKVYPFKSQNMSSKYHKTKDGKIIAIAQALQAWAAGLEPHENMNPILLIPNSDLSSMLIINGEDSGETTSVDYFRNKAVLREMITERYKEVESLNDLVIIEGAGSPAEINLSKDDIVNMGMARIADAPVLLVTDIDRGGSFAAVYGTVMLLENEDRRRIKGIVFNKFRGDRSLLEPGIEMLEKLIDIPVVGIIPYIDLNIADEDTLTDKTKKCEDGSQTRDELEEELEKLAEVIRANIDMDIICKLAGI
ncbi:cobyric acid synthase [Gudongella oleilytica]|jgi:adenosylcobyric acid synthase|uniref:cobyric acid synthase n=1 Tax=Gudongella oleilytica TaxID=1582259 RepID=UPI002A36AB10|nr:cobyric acid synthase [Gudongella oleilytica]MDY0257384.1 cobyric acid synthase [Gudongella oleilytica]